MVVYAFMLFPLWTLPQHALLKHYGRRWKTTPEQRPRHRSCSTYEISTAAAVPLFSRQMYKMG